MAEQFTIDEIQSLINQSKYQRIFQPQVLAVDYDELTLTIKMRMSDDLE